MTLVIDTSAIIALALDDEDGAYAAWVLDEILARKSAMVPSIFWYEVRNVLVVNERRGRITRPRTDAFLASLGELPIEIAPLPPDLGVLDLAREMKLSVYDAAYLELAHRSGEMLASLDRKLRAGARSVGIEIFAR